MKEWVNIELTTLARRRKQTQQVAFVDLPLFPAAMPSMSLCPQQIPSEPSGEHDDNREEMEVSRDDVYLHSNSHYGD